MKKRAKIGSQHDRELIGTYTYLPGADVWKASTAVFAVLTGLALIFATQNWITGGPYGRLVWPRNITVALVQWWTWGMLAPPIILVATRYPLLAPSMARIGTWAACLCAAYLTHLILVTGIERALDRVTPAEPLSLTLANLLRKRAGIDALTLVALALVGHALLLHSLWRRERQSSASRRHQAQREQDLLAIAKSDRTIFISPDTVRWVEAAGNYAIVHAGGDQHMVRATLNTLAARLGPDFVRISRSALVNLRLITSTKAPTRNGDLTLVLSCGQEMKLTRSFRRDVLERLPRLH